MLTRFPHSGGGGMAPSLKNSPVTFLQVAVRCDSEHLLITGNVGEGGHHPQTHTRNFLCSGFKPFACFPVSKGSSGMNDGRGSSFNL